MLLLYQADPSYAIVLAMIFIMFRIYDIYHVWIISASHNFSNMQLLVP